MLREEKFDPLLLALVRANRLDEKINDRLLCVRSDLKISDNYIGKVFEDLKQSCFDLRLNLESMQLPKPNTIGIQSSDAGLVLAHMKG